MRKNSSFRGGTPGALMYVGIVNTGTVVLSFLWPGVGGPGIIHLSKPYNHIKRYVSTLGGFTHDEYGWDVILLGYSYICLDLKYLIPVLYKTGFTVSIVLLSVAWAWQVSHSHWRKKCQTKGV